MKSCGWRIYRDKPDSHRKTWLHVRTMLEFSIKLSSFALHCSEQNMWGIEAYSLQVRIGSSITLLCVTFQFEWKSVKFLKLT